MFLQKRRNYKIILHLIMRASSFDKWTYYRIFRPSSNANDAVEKGCSPHRLSTRSTYYVCNILS